LHTAKRLVVGLNCIGAPANVATNRCYFAFFILHSIRFAASPGARERYQGDHRLAFADRF
jgi:hypothetical protein